MPSGDYESEGRILDELDACAEVKSTMGLANIEAMDGYMPVSYTHLYQVLSFMTILIKT